MSSETNLVSVERVERKLRDARTGDDTVESFLEFGKYLVSGTLHRASQQDLKLRTVLGWAAALFAFTLVGPQAGLLPPLFSYIASLLSGVSAYFSYHGLQARKWSWPSERDWFDESVWSDAKVLKKHYVKQLLITHQRHATEIESKGRNLVYAERFLLAAVILATVGVIAAQTGTNISRFDYLPH